MPRGDSLLSTIEGQPAEAPALLGAGAPPLTYGALATLARRTLAELNELGIGRGDRVAIVLPNGPAMAAAFLAVASGATTCPLNPAYKAEEFAFYLDDLGAKALILPAGSDTPARGEAERLGLAVLELSETGRAAGDFALEVAHPAGAELSLDDGGPGTAADQALILHTSGTTSRPKIVPLTQLNLLTSAGNIGAALGLTPADRCLNIMPLFHIHGLVAATLATVKAGGSLWASQGFNALRFMAWLAEAKPTWYTAVPTMHQAILSRAQRQEAAAKAAGLRFIRSSSASLPPQVMRGLEALFDCPVIESYGMTEAATRWPATACRRHAQARLGRHRGRPGGGDHADRRALLSPRRRRSARSSFAAPT